jgi:3'(2'), 5'-bisphosphate nucleotidase
MDAKAELAVALDAVRRAMALCVEVQATLVSAETVAKQDKSPVTVADFASQAVVCAALAAGSSVAAIVGEEAADALRGDGAARLRARVIEAVRRVRPGASQDQVLAWIGLGGHRPRASGGRYWTLDPIDGTKGFLRHGHYAVALALIEDGRVVLGALGCPGFDAVFTAARGAGARQHAPGDATGTPIRVAEGSDPATARLCESVESGHSDQSQSARIATRLGITTAPVRMDSQAKYAALARGDASIYLRLPTRMDYREKIWDHAAGALVVSEAGGRVTDVTGAALDFGVGEQLERNRGVVATTGAIHDAVLAAVRAELG